MPQTIAQPYRKQCARRHGYGYIAFFKEFFSGTFQYILINVLDLLRHPITSSIS